LCEKIDKADKQQKNTNYKERFARVGINCHQTEWRAFDLFEVFLTSSRLFDPNLPCVSAQTDS